MRDWVLLVVGSENSSRLQHPELACGAVYWFHRVDLYCCYLPRRYPHIGNGHRLDGQRSWALLISAKHRLANRKDIAGTTMMTMLCPAVASAVVALATILEATHPGRQQLPGTLRSSFPAPSLEKEARIPTTLLSWKAVVADVDNAAAAAVVVAAVEAIFVVDVAGADADSGADAMAMIDSADGNRLDSTLPSLTMKNCDHCCCKYHFSQQR